jgi:hypothetical protein
MAQPETITELRSRRDAALKIVMRGADKEDKVAALLAHQVKDVPPRPSARIDRVVSADLEGLIMQCLEKSPEKRPASAEALDEALAACSSAGAWTTVAADNWWRTNSVGIEVPVLATMAEKTLVIAQRDA